MKKFYFIAGEASGDLHGSNLVKELRKQDPSALFRGFGGDMMQKEGVELVRHIRDLDFMGFWEIMVHLRTILGLIRECKDDIIGWKPDAIVLIDYPGFNLRIAEFANKNGIRVFYYVSPQLWAWKQGRISKIRKFVDRLFVILPFEKDFYARFGYEVDFVGHPLLDAIGLMGDDATEDFRENNELGARPLIALLPGSRKQEIRRILPEMLKVIPWMEDRYQFVVAGADAVPPGFYQRIIGKRNIHLFYNQTYRLLRIADAALITSGTATLEAALIGVPQLVCYKAHPVSFFISKKLVRLKFISLVNLIMDRQVVQELIQKDLNVENLTHGLKEITSDDKKREQISEGYVELRRMLGGKGASKLTADLILKYLSE